ncbi:diguanylate cyclase [Alteromonas sp. KUL49]|uniref:GGDEF domain-containing protein n=1 Tax=Alteromonas sp. KUL49 TaxID=2480798 RepID=UPI00102F2B12|nr:diguanylate cyclase [Alteromonas sp. KUL49]TAP35468.1 diguanylate cyclase [Alteromonas sp. KUL49]GEA13342.1 hypothetical protein KUL49_37170 [Alteromonas sp. KUL49]
MKEADSLKNTLKLAGRRERDLEKRSKNGAYIYTAIWLVVGLGTQFYQRFPLLFIAILALFVFLGLGRLLSHKYSEELRTKYNLLWNFTIYFNALAPVLTLGVIFSLSVVSTTFEPLFLFLLICMFGVLSGGIVNFAPRFDVSASFVLALLVPAFISLVFFSTNRLIEAVLISIYGTYMFLLARKMNKEYTTRVMQQLQLEQLNNQDSLTGIANRRSFDKSFVDVWGIRSRPDGRISLMLIDIDLFKRVNDTYGHAVGDDVIKKVAKAIREVCRRESDIVARIGGEEFAVLISTKDQDFILELAERIRSNIENMQMHSDTDSFQVTVSIGVATLEPSREMAPKTLFTLADSNLYVAKESGRNRVVGGVD